MRLKLILAANLIAILLFAGLNCNALPFLETPTVLDEGLGRIQGTLQASAATVSGRVYEGDFRDESKPFPNVRVELCCSNDQKNRGRVVDSATTDAKGWYELTLPSGCEFYDIVVTVPEGHIAAGADSVGGDVIDENWIQYSYPLDRSVLTGNKFWIKKSALELPFIPLRPLVPVTPQEPETVSCPKACECMTEEMAKEKFGKYERCSPEICGYDDLRRPMYCFRPIEDVPMERECPQGCECMTEEMAKEKFGKYERCSPEICGYDDLRRPMYCFRPIEDVPLERECPRGCECMTEEMAKEKFGKYERCSPEICGYDDLRRPMYCFRPTEFPPETECPEGCECLLEEVAAEKFGGYEWCSDEVCGFSEGNVPKYCFRPIEVPEEKECPEGCECLMEEVAAEKFGRYEWCSDEICGIGVGRVPKYCFKPVEDLPEECPQGCECLVEEAAAEKFGRYEWCSDEICGLSDAGVPKYCFRPAEPAPEVPPESCELYFSTEEDFIALGPIPPDGNPIISDGDLLGPGCVVFARNRELLAAFNVNVDLGLDAVDVIDAKGRLVAFSTELDDPSGRFAAGDLLATNGLVIPNSALLAEFDVARMDLGLDSVHFVGDPEDITSFLDRSSQMGRDEWLKDPGILPEMLREYGVNIWFSTEGTPSLTGDSTFIDGDLLSARDGIIVAPNSVLLPPAVPAGIPNRGVDFGLDAATADRDGNREQIRFSTEILFEGEPLFSDGDVLLIGDGVTCTNEDLVRCFEPKTRELGLDALSMAPRGEPEPQTCYPDLPAPELVMTGKEDFVLGGKAYTRYEISVTNWDLYPAELFEAAPDLPPCGTNTEASRTWIEIYDQDGGKIYGFCSLSSPEGLRQLWFDVERGAANPKSVYIVLTDRRCDAVYVSNMVSISPSDEERRSPIEIYFADARESPGSVYRLRTSLPSPAPGVIGGSEETIYTRPSRNLYSFAFHPYLPEKLYFVNANEDKIYRSSETNTGWTREETVYDHDTYVRDLAFDLDQDGDLVLYFSEATGAGADGKIYRIEDDATVLYRTIALSDVDGFWSGDFAFGEDGTLYLSSGNRVPASIYEVDEGGVREIFTDTKEPIKGLVYRDGFLYYANWGTKIYRLDLMTIERATVYSNPERKWLSDVGFRGDTSEVLRTAVL